MTRFDRNAPVRITLGTRKVVEGTVIVDRGERILVEYYSTRRGAQPFALNYVARYVTRDNVEAI
jgi:hypothetical protein